MEERWDDDGEPHGTAGPPILQVLAGAELWNVQIGVVRWFGGTKLGTGGLVRAYGGTARKAIDTAPRKIVVITKTLEVIVPGERIGVVYALADKLEASPEPPEFTPDGMKLHLTTRRSRAKSLMESIIDSTAGQARVEIIP